MWQQQGTVTDKLVTLIQKLQLRRETGQLTARHGDGITTEEGSIVFVNGKVTEARLGRRTGAEALNKLSMWENCLCWFLPSGNNASEPHIHAPPDGVPEPLAGMQAKISPSASISASQTLIDPSGGNSEPTRAPYHVSSLQPALSKIEHLGLSRAHRHLFLLIDGRRSIPDLIRLTGRAEDDVYRILHDLEHAWLIRIPTESSH